jgi:cell wall-associated NlpC family hydrolase
VQEAHTWLRTPYAHRQRLKGVAVDCAQLPLAVYAATGLIPPTDVGEYAAQWHMHRGEERYLGWVEKFATEIPLADVQAGDFLVWRFGRVFSHGAIALDAARVIHAVARAHMVIIENRLTSAEFRDRPCKAFSPWKRS